MRAALDADVVRMAAKEAEDEHQATLAAVNAVNTTATGKDLWAEVRPLQERLRVAKAEAMALRTAQSALERLAVVVAPAATASGASDANGTAAPATNVSASLGGGGGAVVVPPASHTSAAFGGAGLATDEVRVSHELREAASEALLAAAKEEESPRLTGWLATPPTKTAAFLLQLENGGRMTRANAATVLAALEAALGADGELVRAWRLQAVLGPSAVAAEGALALPRTAGLRGGMPPKGVAAKRGGDGGGGRGRGRGGGGRGRGRGTVAAGRGKAPAVDKRKADAVASNSRAVSGGGGTSKRPKANPKALTCDESDSCSDGKAKAVASESDSEMSDDEPVPVPAKTSSEDVAAAIVGEHGGGEVAAACSAAVAGTTPTPVKPRPLTLNPQQREDQRRKAARVLAKASSALLPSTKPAAPPKPNGRDDGGAARGDSSSGHGEAVRTGAGAAAGAAAPAAGNAPAELAANAAAEAEGSPEDSTDEAAAAGSSTAPVGVYVVGLAESGGASVEAADAEVDAPMPAAAGGMDLTCLEPYRVKLADGAWKTGPHWAPVPNGRLDIFHVPKFAATVLKCNAAELQRELVDVYPVRRSGDAIVPGTVQWVDGDNEALKYRGNAVKRSKMWLQRGDPKKDGFHKYFYVRSPPLSVPQIVP